MVGIHILAWMKDSLVDSSCGMGGKSPSQVGSLRSITSSKASKEFSFDFFCPISFKDTYKVFTLHIYFQFPDQGNDIIQIVRVLQSGLFKSRMNELKESFSIT